MKKQNLCAILPLAIASLAFTGCYTTKSSYVSSNSEGAYSMGLKELYPRAQLMKESLVSSSPKSLATIVEEASLRSIPVTFFYGESSNELEYDLSGLHEKDRPRFEGDDITADNDLITFLDEEKFDYVPDIGFWIDKGNEVNTKKEEYTNISRRAGKWKFDTDIDPLKLKKAEFIAKRSFSNGSELVIVGSPDDKEYASIELDVPYVKGMEWIVESIKSITASAKSIAAVVKY